MDCPDFDVADFAGNSLPGVSKERFYRYIEMLQDAGYIKNAGLKSDISGGQYLTNTKRIRITLQGLEYLQENSTMRKVYNALRGVTDLIP